MDKVMLVSLVSVQICLPDLAKITNYTPQMFNCTVVHVAHLFYKMI